MKAIIELPIFEINILTSNKVLDIINSNRALNEVLVWFSSVNAPDLSKINCFFNYIIPRLSNVVSLSYIIDNQIENLEELTLFLGVICKEHFVDRNNIAVDKLANNIARLLMLKVPADQYYFYKDLPTYNDSKIEFLITHHNTKNIRTYGLNENGEDFNNYILHMLITDSTRDFLAKVINQPPELFVNNSYKLRQQIIQHNKNMIKKTNQTKIQNIVCDIQRDLYNTLVSDVNFKQVS